LVRPQPERKVKAWIAAQNLDVLFVSAVSFGELRKAITLLSLGKRTEQLEAWIESDLSVLFFRRILSVTRSIPERWGILAGQRQVVGNPLNVPDGQIAATGLEHDLTAVARNVKDFAGLGVAIFDPWSTARLRVVHHRCRRVSTVKRDESIARGALSLQGTQIALLAPKL
jgi:toxin FitB